MYNDLLRVGMPLAVLFVLLLVGFAATTCLDRQRRELLTPALPAVGLLVTVVALHWTTLLVGTDTGIWIVLAAAAATVVVAGMRDPSRLRIRRRALLSLGVALLLGVPALIVGAQPAFRVDDATVVHPSGNYDAFFYVSDAAWLQLHRGTERPQLGAGPGSSEAVPADQPAIATATYGFRLGEPLIQASVASISGRSLASYWYEVTSGWLMMLPGAAMALAAALRMKQWMGAIAGLGASLSTLALFQVLNQNGPSVLALSVLPLVIATVVRASEVHRHGERGWTDVAVASIAIAGFVGLYPELVTLIGLPIAALLVGGNVGGWRRTLTRIGVVGLGVLAASPLAVYNAQRLLRVLAGLQPMSETDFVRRAFTGSVAGALTHATGAAGINEGSPRIAVAVALATIVVVGLVAAMFVPRLRALTGSVLIACAVVVPLEYRKRDNYALERFTMVGQPIMLLCAFLGISAAVAGFVASDRTWARRPPARGIVVSTAIAGIVFTLWVQVSTQLRITPDAAELRPVSIRPEVVETIGWASNLGDRSGSDVTVLADDYVDRLWLADGLRRRTDVSYPYLSKDYLGVDSFTDGRLTRYLVTSRHVLTNAPAAAIIAANDRYVIYDLAGVSAWFAMPLQGFFGLEVRDGWAASWAVQDAHLLTMRTDGTVEISLSAVANANLGKIELTVTVNGTEAGELHLTSLVGAVTLPFVGAPLIQTVQITASKPGVALPGGDQRQAAFNLGAHAAGA